MLNGKMFRLDSEQRACS
jgi:hypothetical protein